MNRIARRTPVLAVLLAACLLLAPVCLEPACAGSCGDSEAVASATFSHVARTPRCGEVSAAPLARVRTYRGIPRVPADGLPGCAALHAASPGVLPSRT